MIFGCLLVLIKIYWLKRYCKTKICGSNLIIKSASVVKTFASSNFQGIYRFFCFFVSLGFAVSLPHSLSGSPPFFLSLFFIPKILFFYRFQRAHHFGGQTFFCPPKKRFCSRLLFIMKYWEMIKLLNIIL